MEAIVENKHQKVYDGDFQETEEDNLTVFDGGPHREGYGEDDLPF